MTADEKATEADIKAASDLQEDHCIVCVNDCTDDQKASCLKDMASIINHVMRPERERAARVRKALQKLVNKACYSINNPLCKDGVCPVDKGYNYICPPYNRTDLLEARAALEEKP